VHDVIARVMRAFAALALVLASLSTHADEPLVLDAHESRVVVTADATAAYTLDANVAEAVVRGGAVTLVARGAGATQLVVVSGRNVQTVNVIVRVRRGTDIAARNAAARAGSGGSVATHYSSSRAEMQTEIQTSSKSGDREQKSEVTLVHGGAVSGRAAVASASYTLATPSTRVTALDAQVGIAPIVVEQQVVRGIHVESHGLEVHAGITAPTFIDGFVLPMRRQFVAAAAYAWKLSPTLTIEPALVSTKGKGIASLLGRYERGDALQITGELAHGNGTAAGLTVFTHGAASQFALDAGWQPRGFVTASPYDRRGLNASAAWSATLTPRVTASARGAVDNALFAHGQQHTRTGAAELRLRATRSLSLFSGVSYGNFDGGIRSVTIPAGASFERPGFGATALARLGTQTLNGRSEGFRLSAHGAIGSVSATAFVDTETNAPTLALIFRERPDIELLLQQLGLNASTPEEIARILRDHADLIDAGIISSATVNLAPRRTQAGLDLAWLGGRQSLRLRLLQNRIENVATTTTFTTAALTWSRRLGDLTAFDLTAGVWMTNGKRTNVLEAGLRHSFDGLPSFGGGTIRGNVFADDEMTGHANGNGLLGVAVQLDATTTTQTDANGNFAFHGVSAKPHTVIALLPERDSYFTTASRVDASAGDRIAIGVARTPAHLAGRVMSDAGAPVAGITVTLTRGQQLFTAVSDSDGAFLMTAAPGAWRLAIDRQSLPAGFQISESTDFSESTDAAERDVQLSRSATVSPRLVIHAMRTISGRTSVSCATRVSVRVDSSGTAGTPAYPARSIETGTDGSFVIRNLPAGSVTLTAGGNPSKLELPAGPATVQDLRLETRCDSPRSGHSSTR
jgi:hypothetical protein